MRKKIMLLLGEFLQRANNSLRKLLLYAKLTHQLEVIFKHEYIRSRAYICLSLSSSSSSSSSDISSNFTYFLIHINHLIHLGLSRYSCLHLGSLHPRILKKKEWIDFFFREFIWFSMNNMIRYLEIFSWIRKFYW